MAGVNPLNYSFRFGARRSPAKNALISTLIADRQLFLMLLSVCRNLDHVAARRQFVKYSPGDEPVNRKQKWPDPSPSDNHRKISVINNC